VAREAEGCAGGAPAASQHKGGSQPVILHIPVVWTFYKELESICLKHWRSILLKVPDGLKRITTESYDQQGINEESCDLQGINAESCDQQGINEESCDLQGINSESGDQQGINEESCDLQGINAESCDLQGINAESCDLQGIMQKAVTSKR